MTLSLPYGAIKYSHTKMFDELSIPKPLLSDHSTKPNSWGLILIEIGQLIYTRINNASQMLQKGMPDVILSGELHKIAPNGAVKFHIKFYHDTEAVEATRDNEEVVL